MNQKYYNVVGNPEGKVPARIGELAHSDQDIWYVKKYYDTTNVGWEVIDIKSFFTQTPTPTQTRTPTLTPTFTPTYTPTVTPTPPPTQTPTPTLTPTLTPIGAGGPCFSGWTYSVSTTFFNPTAKIVGVTSGAVRSASLLIYGVGLFDGGYGFDPDYGRELGNYTSFVVGEDVIFQGMTGIYVKNGTYRITGNKTDPALASAFTIRCSDTVTTPRIFHITPSVSGKMVWNLDVNGPLLVQGYNTWSISPVTSSFYVNCEVVGGAGGDGGYGNVPPAGYVYGGGTGGVGSKTIGAFTLNGNFSLIPGNKGGTGSHAVAGGSGASGSGYFPGGRGGNTGYFYAQGGGGGGGGASVILNSSNALVFGAGGGGGGGGGGPSALGGSATWAVRPFNLGSPVGGAGFDNFAPLGGGGGGGAGGAAAFGGQGIVYANGSGGPGQNGGGFAGTTIASTYSGDGYIIIS